MKRCCEYWHRGGVPTLSALPVLAHADVDACEAYPCKQTGLVQATCTDLSDAPNSTFGRTCSCAEGYYYSHDDPGGCLGKHLAAELLFT